MSVARQRWYCHACAMTGLWHCSAPEYCGGMILVKQGHFAEHWVDRIDVMEPDGARINKPVPAGGVSTGRGFTISWQNGPLGRDGDRREPNGAFVEDVIAACIGRIEFYQLHFPCQENADALEGLSQAAKRLDDRTRDREARQVEGTHKA